MAVAALKEEVDSITQCSICVSSFTDPRVLPCIHTYCCKCIKAYCKDKKNGDEATCPLCRNIFSIPDGGVEELPKNFYFAKLLSIESSSVDNHETQVCDVCSPDESVSTDKTALMFCIDCQQKQCSVCHSSHSKFKQFQSHKTVSICAKVTKDETDSTIAPSYCERHTGKLLEIYCVDCKAASCVMCCVEQHNGHKFSDIKKVSDERRVEITRYVECLNECMARNLEKLKLLDDEMKLFTSKVGEIETEICEQAQQVRDLVEENRQALLNELCEVRKSRMKAVDSLCNEIKQHTSMMESFKNRVNLVMQKENACDVVRQADNLKLRFDGLVINGVNTIEKSADGLGSIDVSFASADVKWKDDFNVVGKLTVRLDGPSKHCLFCSIKRLSHPVCVNVVTIISVGRPEGDLLVLNYFQPLLRTFKRARTRSSARV